MRARSLTLIPKWLKATGGRVVISVLRVSRLTRWFSSPSRARRGADRRRRGARRPAGRRAHPALDVQTPRMGEVWLEAPGEAVGGEARRLHRLLRAHAEHHMVQE